MAETQKKNNSTAVAIGRIVMNTIRKYAGSKGVSLPQLKKLIREKKKMDIAAHDSEIKLALKNAMNRGILLRDGGFYKMTKEKSRGKGIKATPRKKEVKQVSKRIAGKKSVTTRSK